MILFKKLFRTILKYKAEFISMIIMLVLGLGVFMGFNQVWISLNKNADSYFDKNNMSDYWCYSEGLFSSEDISKVKNINGVSDASLRLRLNTSLIKEAEEKTISLNVMDEYNISISSTIKGEEYDEESNGIYLSSLFAKNNHYQLHDTLTLSYNGISFDLEIVGLIKNPEYLYSTLDENQIMPNYDNYGYGFITKKAFKEIYGSNIYNEMIIKSELSKNQLEKEINESLGKTLLVLSRDENANFIMLEGEVSECKTFGSLLPTIFLVIALLGMITTMRRITANEKSQIGILKALGFRNKRILWHYTLLGLITALIAAILAIPLGYFVSTIVLNMYQGKMACFDFVKANIYTSWWIYLGLGITVLVISLISFVSTLRILKGTAADSLRPYTPKKFKPLFIERFKIWNKTSFSTRWNLRDIFRNKTRSFMALIGVMACTILLFTALGLRNSSNKMIDILDDKIYNFDYKICISDDANNLDVLKLQNEINASSVKNVDIKYMEKAYQLCIYDNKMDSIRIVDLDNKIINMSNDGAYVSSSLANEYNIKVGSNVLFNLYGSSLKYEVQIIGITKSIMGDNLYITKDCAMGLFSNDVSLDSITKISYLLDDDSINKDEYSFISSIQTKKAVINSYNSFMELMNFMIFVIIVFSILLSFVVLFNLGTISFVERYRELSTLKVVGFNNKKMSRLLIKQNIWLSILGIIIGLPIGYLVLKFCTSILSGRIELDAYISFVSIIIVIVLTLVTSLVVNYFVSRKNKSIDMVASLKVAE